MWYAWSENATRSYGDQRSNPSRRHSAFTRQRPPVGGFGNIVSGVFTPVLANHTKSFNLVDTLSVGVDRVQQNFEPMQRQVESWQQTQITDARARKIGNATNGGSSSREYADNRSSPSPLRRTRGRADHLLKDVGRD